MKPPIIGQKINEQAIDSLIDTLEDIAGADDILYVGYPIAATIEAPVTIPSLLISYKFGLVCFDAVPTVNAFDIDAINIRQRNIVLALKAKLLQHQSLTENFDLAFRINIVTYALTIESNLELGNTHIADADSLAVILSGCSPFPMERLPALNAAIERVANIRPRSRRTAVTVDTSKGGILKKIEGEIANLDSWQKAAAIETPDGPQRIRGLAGSGKTIVLALKAAYLHGERPNWTIAVTFHTRALKQQFNTLINRFYFEDYKQEVDATQLSVMHSYGSLGEPGIYSEICRVYGVTPKDFGYAKRAYGYGGAFQGVCAELLSVVEKNPKPLFDALLIDEAQDLPREFLRLAYHCTRNHRIIWAYDDLQNLSDYQMRSLRETFGEDENRNQNVVLVNNPKKPRQDIILPKCYRNTPWALVAAHALGSGIYRDQQLVQHPDDPILWKEIGYDVVSGDLELGKDVVLQRSPDASPAFFKELLNPDDAVELYQFESDQEQFAAVAQMIQKNITVDELFPHDVAVVFPEAVTAEKRGLQFRQYLSDQGVDSHMVGVTSSRDSFLSEGKVAVTGPYRAKGNEAPVVYVVDADFCAVGSELIKKRNILFTAITRSRGWVRICGCGSGMRILIDEFFRLHRENYKLKFRIPSEDELKRMRTVYRDITENDRRAAAELKKAFEKIPTSDEEAQAVLQSLPKELRERILRGLGNLEN